MSKNMLALFALVLLLGAGCAPSTEVQPENTQESQNTVPENSDTVPADDAAGEESVAGEEAVKGEEAAAEEEPVADGKVGEAPAVQSFTVSGEPFSFSPNVIRVKKGETVKIHFMNTEGFHDWVIDEFNVRTPQIKAGESADITFVADKAGEFEYYCSVGSHRKMGMVGKLVVE